MSRYEELVQAFGEAAEDVPPLQALCEVVSRHFVSRTDEQLDHLRQMLGLVEQYPSLLAVQAAKFAQLEAELRTVVAERTRTDAETDMYPWQIGRASCRERVL